VVQAIQSDTNLKLGNLQTKQEWPLTVPEDLRQHWQALEQFQLYLDKIEQELDARKNRPQTVKATLVVPSWMSRLFRG
jgi:hypothetical protein